MFQRSFPGTAVATIIAVSSNVVQVAGANTSRSAINLQGTGDLWIGPASQGQMGSAGLLAPSGAIFNEDRHFGSLFAQAAAGATIMCRVWEVSS